MQSCEVLFHGEKTGFLAKSTSQPPVLKQKSTSEVVKSTSQVVRSTSQVTGCTSQAVRSASQVVEITSQVAAITLQVRKSYKSYGIKSSGFHKKHLMRKCTRCLTFTGGETRIRTGDKGFAGLCLTTWPSRQR